MRTGLGTVLVAQVHLDAGEVFLVTFERGFQRTADPLVETDVGSIVKQVAERLGNTPAVCRRCYIHPAVLEHYALGRLADLPSRRVRKGLDPEEVALLLFLQALEEAGAD